MESVKTELDALNRQYIDEVLWANTRLKDISAIFTDANIDIQVSQTYKLNITVTVERVTFFQRLIIIRIFHGCEMQIEKFVRRSLFDITRLC